MEAKREKESQNVLTQTHKLPCPSATIPWGLGGCSHLPTSPNQLHCFLSTWTRKYQEDYLFFLPSPKCKPCEGRWGYLRLAACWILTRRGCSTNACGKNEEKEIFLKWNTTTWSHGNWTKFDIKSWHFKVMYILPDFSLVALNECKPDIAWPSDVQSKKVLVCERWKRSSPFRAQQTVFRLPELMAEPGTAQGTEGLSVEIKDE